MRTRPRPRGWVRTKLGRKSLVKTVLSPSSLWAVLVAGVVALGVVWLLHLGHVEASSHSATRSFAPAAASVPAGGELEVTIIASDYGGFGK